MNSEINLSYIVTTYNKIHYLKLVLESLLPQVEADEELIIIDGGSTDGTLQYLENLFKSGRIKQYQSEKDKGESHGYNKGILKAKGDLIKIITDDDAFFYPAIKACKKFMLAHPEIDVVGGNTGGVGLSNKNSLNWDEDYYLDFLKWEEGKLKRFFFNGTCLMLRRSSLPLIGLFDSNILLADMEFTLRMTGVVNLSWCSGIISVRIFNPQSNNFLFEEKSIEVSKRLCQYYNYKYPWERKIEEQKKRTVYKKARSFATRIIMLLRKSEKKLPSSIESFSSFADAHNYCIKWLQEHELNKNIQFICKR